MITAMKQARLSVVALVLSLAVVVTGAGCKVGGPPVPPAPSDLASTLVPDTGMDVYLYARQEGPTVLPSSITGASQDVNVTSVAVWGATTEDDFAIGMGIVLSSEKDASRLYDDIKLGREGWKKLSGNTVYIVQGGGSAGQALQTAINNNDFKKYDDAECLKIAGFLPDGDGTRPVAIIMARPGKSLLNFLTRDAGVIDPKTVELVLKMSDLKAVGAGLYSQRPLDIANLVKTAEKRNIRDIDMGSVLAASSGLPGIIVEAAVKKFLTEKSFREKSLGGLAVLEGELDAGNGQKMTVFVRMAGNLLFAATAGKSGYAEELIKGIRLE